MRVLIAMLLSATLFLGLGAQPPAVEAAPDEFADPVESERNEQTDPSHEVGVEHDEPTGPSDDREPGSDEVQRDAESYIHSDESPEQTEVLQEGVSDATDETDDAVDEESTEREDDDQFAGRSGVADNRVDAVFSDGVLSLPLDTGQSTMSAGRNSEIHESFETEEFELVGVVWDAGAQAEVHVELRVRGERGWTGWYELHGGGHHGDGGANARSGTDPLWVGSATALEISVSTHTEETLPTGLSVELVRALDPLTPLAPPEEAPAGSSMSTMGVQQSVPAPNVGRPLIHSRASWGADESIRGNLGNVGYGSVRGVFVHHTATSNNYTRADVPRILRSIYRYHVQSRQFYDIGYNFLIDRFGRIWEGAYGGMDRAVIAAHTQYWNSQSFGVAAIGDFQSSTPPAIVSTAFERIIAWKFSVHGIWDAYATGNYTNSNARPLPVISAHRDAKSTACPGQRLYAQLGSIRAGVHDRITVDAQLRMSGPRVTTKFARTPLSITWRAGGQGLTGRVIMQRQTPTGSWEFVRSINVVNGHAHTVITPGAKNTYRLRTKETPAPWINARDPKGTSNHYRVVFMSQNTLPRVHMEGPETTSKFSRTPLHIYWHTREGAVSGILIFQRRMSSGGWEFVRRVETSDGYATTVITPGANNTYRLRAKFITGSVDAPTSHPAGTSNHYTVQLD